MQIMDSNSLVRHREELAVLAGPESAGLVFDGFTRRIEALEQARPDKPCLYVGLGKTVFGFAPHGGLAYAHVDDETDEDAAPEEITGKARGWDVDAIGQGLEERTIAGAVPTNKMVGDVRIASGVVLIIGLASTAKTPFAHALASAGGAEYATIRYGEPLAGYVLDTDVLSREVGEALIKHKDIVLDSIKDVLAFASGGAMSSGIQRGAFPILSDLSALAAERGCTVYVPLNPSNPDPKVVDMLIEAARSNVASVVVGEAEPNGTTKWQFFTRRGEGLLRDTQVLYSSFKPNELVMTLQPQGKQTSFHSPRHSVATDAPFAGSAVDDMMQAAFRNLKKGFTNGQA